MLLKIMALHVLPDCWDDLELACLKAFSRLKKFAEHDYRRKRNYYPKGILINIESFRFILRRLTCNGSSYLLVDGTSESEL